MKLKSTLLFLFLLGALGSVFAQIRQEYCIQDAVIRAPGGRSELYYCEGDGAPDRARFTVSPFVQPYAYLVTDENNIIILVSKDNRIDLEGLGSGQFRVWAFAYLGNILAQPGQDATTAVLADLCYSLTTNFIPVNGVTPDGGTVSTEGGQSSIFTCRDDGNADVVAFSTTSTDPLYTYVVTDANNTILAFAEDGSFDFETLTEEHVRVWGVSYVGAIDAQIGDNLQDVAFASGCFDLSDNFVEVTRTIPDGGSVALSTGETSRTICAEDLAGDVLSFTSQTDAETPYAFIVTDENGTVVMVLSGNTVDFDIVNPGICRVYGVSYTGELKIAEGDNINAVAISDDCFDLSDNFVEVIKREVDGGRVRLAGGATSANVCVVGGASETLTFENTSTTDATYTYIITDNSNVILAIVDGNTFNFADLDNRANRVWGVSYTGMFLAEVGDNATTAAIASECYDLSDNFISVTRKVVDGNAVALASGATEVNICGDDGEPDLLSFRNTSTSVESYIYVITDENGMVLDFINGDMYDFDAIGADVALVYGLSYSGALELQIGDNINTGSLAGECSDLSGNVVTITKVTVDGGEVALEDGATETILCAGSDATGVLNFTTTSTSDENYAFVITDTENVIIGFADGAAYDFSGATDATFRVWGLSFSGNVLAAVGDDADEVELTDECYELSANFVTVNRTGVDGATVTTDEGDDEIVVCTTEAQPGMVSFVNTSASGNAYAYVLTNDAGIVLDVAVESTFDFTDFPEGSFRVYGISYSGNLTISVDDDLNVIALSDECFDLSDNFVAINIQDVQGGSISLADGTIEVLVCAGDPIADTLDLVNTSGSDNTYTYLLTDETNFIIATYDEASIPLEILEPGTYRIWGLSYTGLLLASPGLIADQDRLARECFELSENFVTVNISVVDGGRINLDSGDTTAIACVGQPLDLTFVNNTTAAAEYRYIVTDASNNVVALPEGDAYSFDTLAAGNYRVWGVSYTGDFTLQMGDNAATTALSSECYALSSNFIAVELQAVDGGTVSLMGGGTMASACGFGSDSGTLTFTFDSDSNADYTFIITDSRGRIFAILNGNSVSFNGVRIGTYRVYGVSYTGDFMASTNDDVETAIFSNECFDLSDNFVTVRKEETDGGTIASVSGEEEFNACPGNGVADLVELTTDGNSSGNYSYVLTNEANEFIALVEGSSIDFDTLSEGTYRIWGLAYTGNLLIQPGDNAAEVSITDQCFDLSDNFITVVSEIPNGGSVFTIDNSTEEFTCPADGDPDVIEFYSEGASGANFVFLITDENNIIEAITETGSYDFEQDTEGINRIWGLSYTGNLTAQVGDDAAAVDLSDDCFDLSDNFVEVIREIPFGGDVFLQNGETAAFVCSDGDGSMLQFDSTGTSRGEYIYVITDEDNIIRNGIFGDEFDFSFLPAGTYRVWGLAYTGMLTAAIGDTVTNVAISDDCYDLSETFATVVSSQTDGATVAIEGGVTEISVCVGDGEADEITFVNTSTSSANYAYLITDKNNGFLTLAMGDGFDFETTDPDTCRVWGLSYGGELQLNAGDDVTMAMLTSGCFELSENFIEVVRLGVDGGMVNTNFNSNIIYTCVNDGVSDLIQFSNTSTATASNYIYVLTNESNVIRGTVSGEQFDFETAGVGVTRVWGVYYTGDFTGGFGANVTTAMLSDGCFELSENFITVARDQPFGGDVTTADGETSAFYCPSPTTPGIDMATTSDTRVGYVFVVTDENNDILLITESSMVDLSSLAVGTYRIWGLSYTGELSLEIGGNILGTAPLATSCFEISSGFVEVYRATSVDGGMISNLEGPDTLYVCPNDSADVVSLFNDSEALDANYRYVLTNMNNVILSRNLESEVINFDDAMPGAYRIWGVSYTGEFLGIASDNVENTVLSDSCYETSSNFIAVFVDTPDGGNVATTDSLTEISVVLDDDQPDPYSFINIDASIVKYQYIVTDESNEIIAILDGNSVDFEDLPATGFMRVWGVAYTGNFTAQVGDDAAAVALSDDCFDLSENFILVAVAVPVAGDDAPAGALQYEIPMATVTAEYSPLELSVYPNPAVNRINVAINAERPQEEKANLRIYSLTGQLMYEDKVQIDAGANQVQVQISDLPDGLYLLQLRNGEKLKTVRFMKQ